ncbi:Retrotransposon gag domain [Sesbania bispinosa]|nr:Retrotransposon gag domain [Sesbania bispinosa]
MAENTRMKELVADVKRMLELMETRDKEYSHRFEVMESSIEVLLHKRPVGDSSSGAPPPPFQVRNIKLDFPRFDGTDVLQWIFKAEQFFDYYKTPDDQRLTIAAIHLDKGVVPWFQMMSRNNPFHTWIGFTRALELEFGPSPYECPRVNLFKLSQVGMVHDYYAEFTVLSNRVYGVSTNALLDCFISGLKLEIRRDVIAQSPTSLLRTVSLAKLPPTMKRMSSAEMQLRREKGLCYTCDEKFSPSHKCPNKQYLLLQVEENDNIQPEPDSPDHFSESETHGTQEHHLSYNALSGSSGLGTMQFQGYINGMLVQVLLDGGSSDNFLQPRLAHCLKLPIEHVPNTKVVVGNDHTLVAEGLIRELEVKIQGHSIKLLVYLLPVAGADLVLGAAWLATLGPYISDYSTLTIKFYVGDHFITWYGERPQLPRPTQFHYLRRMTNTHAISELFTLQFQPPDCAQDQWLDLPTDLDPKLVVLLYTYQDVFAIPNGLPPHSNFAVSNHPPWQPTSSIASAYPDLNLEDKVVSNGGGIVTNENGRRVNEAIDYADERRHVAADNNDHEIRKSARIKITNSRLKDFVWERK